MYVYIYLLFYVFRGRNIVKKSFRKTVDFTPKSVVIYFRSLNF